MQTGTREEDALLWSRPQTPPSPGGARGRGTRLALVQYGTWERPLSAVLGTLQIDNEIMNDRWTNYGLACSL